MHFLCYRLQPNCDHFRSSRRLSKFLLLCPIHVSDKVTWPSELGHSIRWKKINDFMYPMTSNKSIFYLGYFSVCSMIQHVFIEQQRNHTLFSQDSLSTPVYVYCQRYSPDNVWQSQGQSGKFKGLMRKKKPHTNFECRATGPKSKVKSRTQAFPQIQSPQVINFLKPAMYSFGETAQTGNNKGRGHWVKDQTKQRTWPSKTPIVVNVSINFDKFPMHSFREMAWISKHYRQTDERNPSQNDPSPRWRGHNYSHLSLKERWCVRAFISVAMVYFKAFLIFFCSYCSTLLLYPTCTEIINIHLLRKYNILMNIFIILELLWIMQLMRREAITLFIFVI